MRLKHVRAMGMKCCWTKIRRVFRRRRKRSVFVEIVAVCVKVRVCRIL
jgi:hypothetical protein